MIYFLENSGKFYPSQLWFFKDISAAKQVFPSYYHSSLEIEFEYGANHSFYLSLDGCNHFIYILPTDLLKKDIANSMRRFLFHHKKRLNGALKINFDFAPKGEELNYAFCCSLGLEMGNYNPALYKQSPQTDLEIDFKHTLSFSISESLLKAQQLAMGKTLAMNLVNGAPNFVTPRFLAQSLVGLADENCKAIEFWNQELVSQRLFGIEAVGRGSGEAGLVVLDYCPPDYGHTLALVGKGVTFDAGGISLKDRQNLMWLKSDMGGAAAVVGATMVAIKRKMPLRIIAALPVCENMPDGKAFRPGDVIETHAGKSVEIEDTDAEGRLILADAISWLVSRFQPDTIIDLATLTGASVHALGYQAAALCCPSPELSQELLEASDTERLWPLPMWKEYETALSSDVADLKNFGGPAAGAITAAKFLEAFTQSHPRWAHIDMASTVMNTQEFAKNRVATGFGVELLVSFMSNICSNFVEKC